MLSKVRSEVKMVENINQIDGSKNIAKKDISTLEEAIRLNNEKRKAKSNDNTASVKKKLAVPTAKPKRKKLITHKEPSIKIMFANADQLTNSKKDELETCIKQNKPSVIAITEAKPKNSNKSILVEVLLSTPINL